MSGGKPMTEAEWQACADPRNMLRHLGDRAGKRRCFLFACACERRLWEQPDCEKEKILAAERYADGLAEADELLAALEDIGIDLGAPENVLKNPLSWARYESEDSAEFAANVAPKDNEEDWRAAYDAERGIQAVLLRCIFGNPFRPASADPSWLACNDGAAPKMAQAIYDDRAFDRLPLLADALEEAGCDDREILDHCRSGGEHVRGCWVVDLLLGKL
jgi:hypothetical protein